MKKLLFLSIVFFQGVLNAQVWVYNYPDVIVSTEELGRNIRSGLYDVKVVQQKTSYDCYVLADYNTFPDVQQRALMTDWNHSSTFSFKGEVEVVIERKDGKPVGSCKIFPLVKNIPFNVKGNKVFVSLSDPLKFYVEMEGLEKEPLFIFADAPEVNPPMPDDSNVLLIEPGLSGAELKALLLASDKEVFYFGEGIHSFGEQTDLNYAGYQIPILSNKHYYIPGGAFIIGSFRGNEVSNTSFTGRGIISACGKERLSQAKSIPYNLIMFDGSGKNQLVEGLTFTNPAHFILLSRGEFIARNTKMFGWWHQTDGWGGGDNSIIEDSFLKVMDDYVKMYNENQIARELTIYKQINGAVIQLGWNSGANGKNCLAENIYVVKDSDKIPRDISNTAVINLKNNSGQSISNFYIRNLYLESDVQRILGVEMKGGSMKNFIIENVFLSGKNNNFNYLFAHENSEISNFVLKNWQYKGKAILNDEDAWMKKEGLVENIRYEK